MSEDDEAADITNGKKIKADYPFKSKANANQEESKSQTPNAALMSPPDNKQPDGPDASESVLDDEDTETEEVAAGEVEGADKDADDAEREIWRKIE